MFTKIMALFDSVEQKAYILNTILNSVSDGLFIADKNRSVVFVKASALDIFGIISDFADKNIHNLICDKALIGAIEDCIALKKPPCLKWP